MKRPSAIIWFERFYALGIALPTIFLIATWQETTDPSGDDGAAIVEVALFGLVLIYGLSFLFWFLIMRRRSNIARWLLTVLTLLAAPLSFIDPNGRPWDFWGLVEAGGVVASIVAVACLISPGARPWFDGSPDDLAETFS